MSDEDRRFTQRSPGGAPGEVVSPEALALARVLESMARSQYGQHRPALGPGRGASTPAGNQVSSETVARRPPGPVHRVGPAPDGQDHAGANGFADGPGWVLDGSCLADEVTRREQIDAGRRARRLPYVATGATAAAGYAAWGVGEAVYVLAGPGGELVATAGTAGLCAVALGVLRLCWRRRIPPAWRRRWWVAGTAAGTWVTTASAVGAGSWPMTAALAVGAAAASARWSAVHEVPRPLPDPTPAPALPPAPEPVALPAVVEDEGAVLERRWADTIAARGRALPDSLLTNRTDLPNGIAWTVQTVPGSTSFDTAFALRRRIAGGLQVPAARVLLEPSEVDESHFALTVITRDVLAAGVPYPGPRYVIDGTTHTIPLGPWADGSGWSDYVAVDGVGCRNGMATGEPGSGKSAFLEAVAMGLRSSGRWWVMFGDGDPEGGSSPLLNEVAHWAEAGPQGVLAQLEAVEALLVVRGMLQATLTADPDTGLPIPLTDPTRQRPLREMRPSPAFPGVQWILDELHRLSSDAWLQQRRFIPRVERAVRIGRKYGLVLLTGSQSLLVPDYGNSTPLRGYLAARNLFAFRNGNKTEKAVVSGLEIAPSVLPAGGGYAFAGGSGRLAMTRVAWAPDMARHAAELPATTLDPDTTLALAQFLPAAPRDPAAVLADQQARLTAWRAGRHQQGLGQAKGSAATPHPTAALGAGLGGLQVPAALTAANVIPLRRPVSAAPAPSPATTATTATTATGAPVPPPSTPTDEGPDLDALRATQRAVYDALVATHEPGEAAQTGQLAEATGLKLPAVSKALSALADLGLAHSPRYGTWAPGPDPTGATAGATAGTRTAKR